ncbi:transporter substrate-binding domain-containing protein [Pseudoduganella ginsengisoli]|uniref:Transporter substrate-binding domain-containing protein n=1 Tax=Pseudoduganella ginsengisoli TaxID=1462440 RepID=A0A6L6Q6S7_9BURK|nr:transporter substrate-binding domain-containing protein [Pseudoduganella ginsengisoli]MTW05216.1 transporter substrate-binding domain-containing protein [Pseudoduganella ginsengisoli]
MAYPTLAATVFLSLLCCAAPAAMAACEVTYPQNLARIDTRYDYDWRVLQTVLEKTAPQYGDCSLQPSAIPMEQARATLELSNPRGRINVLVRSTTRTLERQFLPIRIPVDKGLLGYRIMLVRAQDVARFAKIQSVDDLRAIKIGQGKDWSDIPILRAAGLQVVEGANYEGLFGMLAAGRFDAFSRAVDEALREVEEQHAAHPQLVVEPGLLLYYPLPRYFFVRRDAEGVQLAQRIEAGLETMIRDGTLEQLFQRYKKKTIDQGDLQHRNLIVIDNPDLSPETPLSRTELWFSPVKNKPAK